MADRAVLSLLIGPIKSEFNIGDFQASLLMGPAFALFYAIGLIPLGWAADTYSRRKILVVCLIVWSIASVGSGLAFGFASLFLMRMLIGAGEAGLGPCGYGIIGASFPRDSVAKPISVQNMGYGLGAALGIAAGGALLSYGNNGSLDHLPIIGHLAPWRITFILVGLPGILAIAMAPLLYDPPQQSKPKAVKDSLFAYLNSNRKFWPLFFIAATSASISMTCLPAWIPELLQRRYGYTPIEAGTMFGPLMFFAAGLSPIVYSAIADALSKRGQIDSTITVGLVPLLLTPPITIIAMSVTDRAVFMPLLALLISVVSISVPMAYTIVQQMTSEHYRSRVAALNILLFSIFGFGIGTSVVGWLSEFIFGEDKLHLAIVATVLGPQILAIIGYIMLRKPARDTLLANR